MAVWEAGDLDSAGDKAVDAEETVSRSAERALPSLLVTAAVAVVGLEREVELGLRLGLGPGFGLLESRSESGSGAGFLRPIFF